MTKKKEVIRELLSTFVEAQDLFMADRRDASRIKFLRPSQLPFCAPGFFVAHASLGMVSTMDFMGSFYTTVGTAVHEVMQRFLSPSGRFLADWKCRICGRKRKLSTKSECCDFTMDYHEIKIDHKGVVGHIDAVFKDSKGRYWILDFKTCTIAGSGYKKSSPGAAYMEQVETYAYMLWKQYGIKVEGVMLMFIPRDNPLTPTVWVRLVNELSFQKIAKRIKRYKIAHREALDAVSLEDALALAEYGRCKGEWCRVCKSSEGLKKQIKRAHKMGKAAGYLPLSELQ